MKIDNSLKVVDRLAAGSSTGKSSRAKPGAGVSVGLGGLSSRLQALDAQVSSGEAIDAAYVCEIKQAISDGRFKVNPDVVADRLLHTVQELIVACKLGHT